MPESVLWRCWYRITGFTGYILCFVIKKVANGKSDLKDKINFIIYFGHGIKNPSGMDAPMEHVHVFVNERMRRPPDLQPEQPRQRCFFSVSEDECRNSISAGRGTRVEV